MAKKKTILNRLQVVQSTRKITQAIKMVSCSKAEKNKKKHEQVFSYLTGLQNMLPMLEKHAMQHHALCEQREKRHTLCIVIGGDKGLCGGYNQQLTKKIVHSMSEAKEKEVTVLPIGQKILTFCRRHGIPHVLGSTARVEEMTLEQSKSLAKMLQEHFLTKKYSHIIIISQLSFGEEHPNSQPLLPVRIPLIDESVVFPVIFEPDVNTVVNHILSQLLGVQLYEAILGAQVIENQFRMVAMNKATDNADDLLRELRLTCNRMRQTAITQDLMEVTAGFLF